MIFIQSFDPAIAQYTYILGCEQTKKAIIIDPQRSIDHYLELAAQKELDIVAVTETHIHADFLSGVHQFIKDLPEIKVYLSDEGRKAGWAYNWVQDNPQITLLKHNDKIEVGSLTLIAWHTPGHTPEHLSFVFHENNQETPLGAFTGDFIFVGDLGRPDLLEKAAKISGTTELGAQALFHSVQSFYQLPQSLIIWPCHGAGSACGKSLGTMPYTSWGYEQQTSPPLQISDETKFGDYITQSQKEPPLYFATMKKLNRDGVPLLKQETLSELNVQQVAQLIEENSDLTILDPCSERVDAMTHYLPHSLLTPESSFSTAVGSLVPNPNTPLIILSPAKRAKEFSRQLFNIGYDHQLGFIDPDKKQELYQHLDDSSTIPILTFQDDLSPYIILDLRTGFEHSQENIPGSIHIPYNRLSEYLDQIPTGQPLAVHCASGKRASMGATALKKLGYNVSLINDSFSQAQSCQFNQSRPSP